MYMDKPLSYTKKDNTADKQAQSVGGAYVPELSQKNWELQAKNLRWDSTPQGRLVERLITRGGLGAAAFAAGNWYARRGVGMLDYKPNLEWLQIDKTKPLQYIAKLVDSTAGEGIEGAAKLFGVKNPERWVLFRHTNNLGIVSGTHGRSLGHETVVVTFDFFCASVADAFGRGVFDAVDPNIKHEWKDTKGHIHPLAALKETAKSLVRYVTYNGGEDWAVALPYVYFVRGQRSLINNFSPRFKYDSDRGLNGGSFKVDDKAQVIGNYNMEGMLDLQGRFTFYNIGTLMYREAYNHVAGMFNGHKTKLYGSPDGADDKRSGLLHDAEHLLKWTARSAIKGVITMTPAVPFFSILRTSQSKYKGLFINQNPDSDGVLGFTNGKGNPEMLHSFEHERMDDWFRKNNPPVTFRKFNNGEWKVGFPPLGVHPLSDLSKPFDAYGQSFGKFDSALNQIGKLQNEARKGIQRFVGNSNWKYKPNQLQTSTYVNAAFAYTPYMYAKRETAVLWDNGKTDMAAERMIDGVANLDLKEIKEGASEVWRAILHKPFADPKREAEAQKRILLANSTIDGMTEANRKALKAGMAKDHGDGRSWQERMISESPRLQQSRKDQYSHTEKQKMLEMLQQWQPPTNSIH